MANNILITGGAGFIGSNLSKRLISSKWNVNILDISDNTCNISDFFDRVNYIRMDVRSKNIEHTLRDLEIDGIVHLAAISRVVWGEKDPDRCRSVNVGGTENLLRAASRLGKKPWFIFGSSREVYGEPVYLPVTEDCKLNPINTYGQAKVDGENLVNQFSKKYGFNSAILRFSNVYGNERDLLDRVIPNFIIRSLKDEVLEINGKGKRFDFTFIEDTIDGIISTARELDSQERFIDSFNICSGRQIELGEVPKMLEKYLEKDIHVYYAQPENYEIHNYLGSTEKAHEILGYRSKVTFGDGLKFTIERIRDFMGKNGGDTHT